MTSCTLHVTQYLTMYMVYDIRICCTHLRGVLRLAQPPPEQRALAAARGVLRRRENMVGVNTVLA